MLVVSKLANHIGAITLFWPRYCRERRERYGAGNLYLHKVLEWTEMTQPGDERHTSSMQAFGALFAEVAVDRDFGLIRMRRLVGAYGVGRVVNPRMARSQAIGGMVGGMG
jgi:CO/xanthine dehydrogenase Mo-binding subunit